MRRTPLNLAPLRHRGFRLLVVGQLASNLGDLFYAVALPWYVLANHGGALLLGTVLAAYGIPRTALLAVSGHAADQWRPWNVMMVADVLRAIGVSALAIAAFSGPARTYLLIPIALVVGAGEGMFLPSSFAIVPSLLDDSDLQAGNALTSGGTQLATLLGPAIGGVLVATLGPALAFAVDAASFIFSAITLVGVRRLEQSARAGTSCGVADVPSGVAAGASVVHVATEPVTLRHVLRNERVLQVILLVTLAANLGSGGMSEVALPALVHGPLHDGAVGYGSLIAAVGAGALVGTLAAGRAPRMRRPAMIASYGFIAEAAVIAAVPYLGSTLAAAVALMVFGLLNGFSNVVTITLFQRWAPGEIMGRLMGILMFASVGIFPVSVFVAGVVVTHAGPSLFFPLGGAAIAVAVLAGISQREWREFGVDETMGMRLAVDPAT
ncbi:MAG TPA: MFS transporter [Acidimicrobiales bacterium]|nr:MFS transporter [Acidimicrobiales bacterium]